MPFVLKPTFRPAHLIAAALLGATAHAAPARCPDAADQLTEALASAKQRVGRDGLVRVAFEVDAQGRARLQTLDGTRSYRTPVRLALQSLSCERGEPQAYVMDIRFADHPADAARAVAQADLR